jgi:bidirectional [NiFe] hydrogenase diaphorase subunit
MTVETQKVRAFTLDGKTVEAHAGETVVDVAARVGVHIPTLCHHRALVPYSSCRVCMVEVKWGTRSKLVASCVYEPYEGDVVETDNPRVRNTRRMILELLLARCPRVKQISDLAREYGARKDAFRVGEHDDPSQRCILCGRCVRVCNDCVGKHVIAYAGRGIRRHITSPFDDQSPDCIGCGACVFVCPTGALHSRDRGAERSMEELHTTLPMTPCSACGQPFATGRQLAHVAGSVKAPMKQDTVCPDCRRNAHGNTWDRSVRPAQR